MHDVVQNTVNTEADAQVALVGLDVDVRGSATERIDHQDIDQPDHRSVLAGASKGCKVDLLVVLEQLKLLALTVLELEPVKRNVEIRIKQSLGAVDELSE